MVDWRWPAFGMIATAAALAAAGCGGMSESEKREARAEYVGKADAICERARMALSRDARPRDRPALERRLRAAERTLSSANADLHDLHDNLGDAANDETRAFDVHLNPTIGAARRARVSGYDHAATRSAAGEIRRTWDALYKAAQPVGFKQCGRGGNRVADLVLFTVYRDQFIAINVDSYRRLRRIPEGTSFESFRSQARRALTIIEKYNGRMRQLSPPLDLRPQHRKVLRLTRRALRTGKQITRHLDRGPIGLPVARVEALLARFERQIDAADRAESRIRRILRPRDGGGGDSPAPGGTTAA